MPEVPNSESTKFYFFPDIHRAIVPIMKSGPTLLQICKFLGESLNQIVSESENVNVHIEKDHETIQRIRNAFAIYKLSIELTPTNEDRIEEDVAEWMDKDNRDSRAGKIIHTYQGKRNTPINLTPFIDAGLQLSKSNGEVSARVQEDTTSAAELIETKDHPAIHKIDEKEETSAISKLWEILKGKHR